MEYHGMNKATTIGLCGVGLTMLLTAGICFFPRDPVVASFQGGEIRRSELIQALENDYGAEELQEMLTQRLIDQAIATNHLSLSDVDLDLWVGDYKLRPDVQEMVASSELDTERLRENLRTTVPLYYLAIKDISETEREKYFEEHRDAFEQLNMSHILLGSQEEAIQLRQRITSPESFATMAIVHSLDDSNRDFAGALGRVTRAELEASFEPTDVQSLFKTPPGTVSRPMQAESGGWHLFLVKQRLTDYQSLKRQVVLALAMPKLEKCLQDIRDQAQVNIAWKSPRDEAAASPTPTPMPSPSPTASTPPASPPASPKATPAQPSATSAPAPVASTSNASSASPAAANNQQ